ncbi:MAG: hypothetical protein V3R81_01365 [Gammaproteobacteria bacterium]
MNSLLDILLARKGDGNWNWVELLVPVIFVIVYAIGGILKMRSNLDKEKSTEEQQKPRYKPLDGRKHSWEQPSSEPAATEISPAQRRQVDRQIERKLAPEPAPTRQPARQPIPTRSKQRKTLDAFLETVAPPKPLNAMKAQAAAAETRQKRLRAQNTQRQQAARKIKTKPAPRKAKVAAKKKPPSQPSPTDSLAERLAQADEIRRAIIYAEILGKPIALRDM